MQPGFWVRSALLSVVLAIGAAEIAPTAFAQVEYVDAAPSKKIKPKSQLVSFSKQPASDLKIDVKFAGTHQLHGQVRYGTPDSTRVALVVDQLSDDPNHFDLYVDLDRDRVVTNKERIGGEGRERNLRLASEIKKVGPPQRINRLVRFRRSIDPTQFSIATLGGYASESKINNQNCSVWRVDGNGNGLFSDLGDEIWLDLNRDGKWNVLEERFLFRSSLKLDGKRFAVRANRIGSQTEFSEIVGEGKLTLKFDFKKPAEIVGIRASIYGDDGSAHSIESVDGHQSIVLPIGRYMVGQISLRVKEEKKSPWQFSFSHSGDPKALSWYEVKLDGNTEIEPLAGLTFDFASPKAATPGQSIAVRPVLKTHDDLYITGSGRGQRNRFGESEGNDAFMRVLDTRDHEIAATTSGFA